MSNCKFGMSWRTLCPARLEEPFLFWLRYEWGPNGNPHAHGQCYVSKSPTFECVVEPEEARRELIAHGHAEANKLQTRDEAEATSDSFFSENTCPNGTLPEMPTVTPCIHS